VQKLVGLGRVHSFMLILGRVRLGHFTCGSGWVRSIKLDPRPTMCSLSRLQARLLLSCGVCLVSVAFVYCDQTAKDMVTVATECEPETVPKLSNRMVPFSTTFSDPYATFQGFNDIHSRAASLRQLSLLSNFLWRNISGGG